MGRLTISMAIFNSYVRLLEGSSVRNFTGFKTLVSELVELHDVTCKNLAFGNALAVNSMYSMDQEKFRQFWQLKNSM